MAALFLSDYMAEPKPLVAGVAKALYEESDFFKILPIENVGTLAVKVVRESPLPSVSWRNLGASHASVRVTQPNEVEEQAYSIGNSIDVDKALLKSTAARLYDPIAYQIQQTTKAIARTFNDAVINGLPGTYNAPTGLWYRVRNDLATAQNITADPSGGSSGLDISPDAASLAANSQAFLDKLDALIYQMADHKADALLMNQTTLLRAWSILRQANVLNVNKDRYGMEFYEYKGARLVHMGFKVDDSTMIVGNTELTNGTALTGGGATSIYGVKFGPEYFTGWQEYALDVSQPTLTDDQITYRSVIDWVVGIAVSHPRSVSRLYGVIAA